MRVINFKAEKYYRLAYDYIFYVTNYNLAQKYIKKVLEIEPEHKKTLALKAELEILKDNVTDALSLYIKLCGLEPDNPMYLAKTAACYELSQDYLNSLKYCNKALEQNPSFEAPYLFSLYRLKIDLLIKYKRYTQAQDILNKLHCCLYSDDIDVLKQMYQGIIKENKVRAISKDKTIL